MRLSSLLLLATTAATPAMAGPLAYGLCQTGCNVLAVACYGAAGFTFGVTIVGAPPVIIACNTGLGTCMAACAATALLAPIP